MQKVSVDNISVLKEHLGYNDGLNFGRFDQNSVIISYEIHVNKVDFINQLESFYNSVREEIKLDDQKHKDTSNFSEVNYCSLSNLLDKPYHLKEIFTTYLRDFFFKDFTYHEKNQFFINSIDDIRVNKDIKIHGKAVKI